MPQVQPLPPQLPKTPVTFPFATATKPASLQIPAAICYTKRCLANNLHFPSLTHTLSSLFFLPFTICPQQRLFVIAQTNAIASYLSHLSHYRSTSHQHQNSYFRHFHSLTIPVHLQILRNLQLILRPSLMPHTPQNFQNLFKYLNLTIFNFIFYLFNAFVA